MLASPSMPFRRCTGADASYIVIDLNKTERGDNHSCTDKDTVDTQESVIDVEVIRRVAVVNGVYVPFATNVHAREREREVRADEVDV